MQIYGLRVVVYPNDHRPAHVHVMGHGCEAVFNLRCPGNPLALRENMGFVRRELARMADGLEAELSEHCHQWRRFHGDF